MSTVDKAFADKIVSANGQLYPDAPFAITRIVEYVNAWGVKTYGMTFDKQDQQKYMRPSEFVIDPHIYWEKKSCV